MDVQQEPKYDVNEEGKIFNRHTGITIPDDEPILIIRAKDKNALPALHFYNKLCENEDHKKVVQARIQDFLEFLMENPKRVKEPN